MVGEIFAAIFIGIIAGYLGRLLLPGKQDYGFIRTVFFGVLGALLGYFAFRAIGIGDEDKFDLGSLPGAVIGVIIVLIIYDRVGNRSRASTG